MTSQRTVQILLSTYNGEPYLGELLESLAHQSYRPIALLARDDGSSDETPRILSDYRSLESKEIVAGEHLGVIRSFFDLLRRSSESASFFAFCDQDDIWGRDKLARAIQLLDDLRKPGPAMYCGRTKYVDKALRSLSLSKTPRRGPSFRNALVENIATGCTIVINKPARDLLLEHIPAKAQMHDAWFYLVLTACGSVVFDNEPFILYRQHGMNVVGVETRLGRRWLLRLRRFLARSRRPLSEQAAEFLASYGAAVPDENARIAREFLAGTTGDWSRRLLYALQCGVWRQSALDSLLVRVFIVLGRV